jgi:hypothetical protein
MDGMYKVENMKRDNGATQGYDGGDNEEKRKIWALADEELPTVPC